MGYDSDTLRDTIGDTIRDTIRDNKSGIGNDAETRKTKADKNKRVR